MKSNDKKIIIFILSIALMCVSIIAIVCGCNMKSNEDKRYLELFPSLLNSYIFNSCDYNKEVNTYVSCEIEEYGIGKDNSPYVIFKSQTFNADATELIDGPYLEKMYFWESENGGFSTAMDKEFKKSAE